MGSTLGAIIDRLGRPSNAVSTQHPGARRGYRPPNPFQKPRTNDTAHMETYGAVSTLFACVSTIANRAAKADWKLYRSKSDQRRVVGPKAEDRTEIVSHVALDLWDSPNDFYTQQFFVESLQQHIDLTGNGIIMVGRNELSSMPLELWPIRPDKITPIPSDENFLAGYIYKGPNGEQIPLEVDQVIHIKMPNPMDPYWGLGPVQALLTDLDATKYAAAYNRNFFLNDATPGGIIEFEDSLTDQEWRSFVERWRESHQGVSNAHRIATIERGKWSQSAFSQRDMQFGELRDVGRDVIREAFGMHKFVLGTVDDVNRAQAEAAVDMFEDWVLTSRLDRVKDALNHGLLKLFGASGQNLEFDYELEERDGTEAATAVLTGRATAAKTLIDAGFDKASVLEAVGLPEIQVDAMKEEQAQAALDGTRQSQELERQAAENPDAGPAKSNGQRNGQKKPDKVPA